MAGLICYQASDEVAVLNSGGWKTLCHIAAPANQRVNILRWGIYCKGTVNTDKPIRGRLIRCSDNGTTPTSKTVQKRNGIFPETPQTAFYHAYATGPTVINDALDHKLAHPQTGFEQVGIRDPEFQLAGGEKGAVQYNNDTGTASIPIYADITWEE